MYSYENRQNFLHIDVNALHTKNLTKISYWLILHIVNDE